MTHVTTTEKQKCKIIGKIGRMNSVIDKIHCSVSLQSIILIVYCIKFILILMKFLKPSDKIIVYVIIGYDSFLKETFYK